MTKILSQTIFLCIALFFFCLYFGEAEANESQRFFFEEGQCEGLGGRTLKLCLFHCEFLECDEEEIDLGPFLNFVRFKQCDHLLLRYGQHTGVAGPPCVCNDVCTVEFEECLSACDPDDFCCPQNCSNARGRCETGCCDQQEEINFNLCIEDCAGDPSCEQLCIEAGCVFSPISCVPPPSP